MKKLLTLNLLIAVLFSVSCKKDNPFDDCGDVPCPDTVYYTEYLFKDTVIMLEAEYFKPGYPRDISTVLHIDSIDMFQFGDYRAAFSYSDMEWVLNEDDSISFSILGGVIGDYVPAPLPADYDYYGCDPSNSVMIAKDTIYYYNFYVKGYAILEIFEGSKSYIDTAYYPLGITPGAGDYIKNVLTDVSTTFVNNGFTTDTAKFNEYLNGYYNIGNTGYFFISIYPNSVFKDSYFILFKYD